MLPKENRLAKKIDVARALKRGRRFGSRDLLIYVRPIEGKTSRFCVVISKAVDKRAVKRNALRRRLKAYLQKELSNIIKPADVVMVARKGLLAQSAAETEENVRYLMGKANLIKKT